MGVGAELGIQLNNYLGINAGYKMFAPVAYQNYADYISQGMGSNVNELPNGDAWLHSSLAYANINLFATDNLVLYGGLNLSFIGLKTGENSDENYFSDIHTGMGYQVGGTLMLTDFISVYGQYEVIYATVDSQNNYGGEYEGSSDHEFEDYEFENYMYSGLKYSTFQGGIKIDLNF